MTKSILLIGFGLFIGLSIILLALLVVTMPAHQFTTPCNQECQYIRDYYYIERVFIECRNQHVFADYTCTKLAQSIVTGNGF